MRSIKIAELFHNIKLHGDLKNVSRDLIITGITANSGHCQPGYLFVAVPGATSASRDGHHFIEHAIAHGAHVVVVDKNFIIEKSYSVPIVRAIDSKVALCHLVETFYGHPSKTLTIIGITGTNGKTSTSFMLHTILQHAGYKPKIMGTLGMGDPGNLTPLSHTTMDPEFISAQLARMKDIGVTHVIMEISSHALSLKRVDAINFSVVALTNITQDHLDFHQDIFDYQAAKARLFFDLAQESTLKILPLKHPFSHASLLKNVFYFGDEPSGDFFYSDVQKNNNGTRFCLKTNQSTSEITLQFLGDFHTANATLAAAIATHLNVAPPTIVMGLKHCPLIPGRLEPIPHSRRNVFVDFAHTPDALSALLKTVRKLSTGKLIVVFGCGGDRDASKRPIMGKIAESLADMVIVTDDNPRSEDAKSIRQNIFLGMHAPNLAYEVPDRKAAIRYAITNSEKNDVIVIAGKGHETYQIYGDTQFPFSDQAEAQQVLDSL